MLLDAELFLSSAAGECVAAPAADAADGARAGTGMHHCGLARLLRGLHAAKVAVFRRPFEPAGTGEPSWEEEEERLRLAAAGLGDADVGWSAVVGLEVDDADGGIVDDADRGSRRCETWARRGEAAA